MEFIYKKLYILSCLNLSPSKYSPFHVIYLLKHFFPVLKTVFELVDFDAS